MVEVTAAGDEARKQYGRALARFTPLLEEGREYSGRQQPAAPTPSASRSAAPRR